MKTAERSDLLRILIPSDRVKVWAVEKDRFKNQERFETLMKREAEVLG